MRRPGKIAAMASTASPGRGDGVDRGRESVDASCEIESGEIATATLRRREIPEVHARRPSDSAGEEGGRAASSTRGAEVLAAAGLSAEELHERRLPQQS